jgi:hypothetical protein
VDDLRRATIIRGRLKAMRADNSIGELARIFNLSPSVILDVIGETVPAPPPKRGLAGFIDRLRGR